MGLQVLLRVAKAYAESSARAFDLALDLAMLDRCQDPLDRTASRAAAGKRAARCAAQRSIKQRSGKLKAGVKVNSKCPRNLLSCLKSQFFFNRDMIKKFKVFLVINFIVHMFEITTRLPWERSKMTTKQFILNDLVSSNLKTF